MRYFIEEVHCDIIVNKCHERNGNNCLHVACQHDQTVVVTYLVEKGGDLTICNKKNETPLHIACLSGSLEMARLVSTTFDPQAYETERSRIREQRALMFASRTRSDTGMWLDLLDEFEDEDENESQLLVAPTVHFCHRNHPSPLHVACKQGKVEIVKHLITEKSWNPELRDSDGSTLLQSACCSHLAEDPQNTLEVIKFLVNECNSDPMKSSDGKASPMNVACKVGKLDLVVALTSKNVNCQDTSGNTPLHLACKYVNLKVVKYLVEEKQCNLTIQNAKRQLPVHIACESKSLELVKVVSDCDLNTLAIDQQTPLHIACKDGSLDIIEYFVTEKRFQHPENSASLHVHALCIVGRLNLVKVLATTQNVKCRDSDGNTPLHIACKYKLLKLAMYLVNEVHSDMLQHNKMGELPLHIACQEEALAIVKFLVLEKRCPQNIKSRKGDLPLHVACRKKSLEMVKLVSDCNVNSIARAEVIYEKYSYASRFFIKSPPQGGDTPLLLACKHGDIDTVKYLLEEKHCDPKVENLSGELPLHYAYMHSLEMVQLVTNWDVKIKPPTAYRHSVKHPLLAACSRGALDIVRYLIEEKQCDPNPRDHSNGDLLKYACGCSYGSEEFDTISIELAKYLVIKCSCDPMGQGYTKSPMQIACKQGNLQLVKALTSNNVNCLDHKGNSPLHVACSYSQVEIVRFLAEEKYCDQNIRNEEGELALHIACREGSLELVKLVVSKCTKVDAKTTKGVTPLHLACEHGSNEIVRILTKEKHCDQSIHNKNGESALHIACRKMLLVNVKLLTGCDANSQTTDGLTPLHEACMTHSAEIVEYLLCERHCNPDLADKEGNTALHLACTRGNVESATFLTQKSQCDQNIRNSEGELALHVACKLTVRTDEERSRQNTLVKIVSSDCNPNIQDNDGDTPLHLAIRNEAREIVKYLVLVKKCDTTISNDSGMLPLHIACRSCADFKTIELVGSKCPDAINKNGDTPLHIACQGSKLEVASFLIEKLHCNPNIKDAKERTPLHIACASRNAQLVEVLRRSDPNSRNADGNTPLHVACYSYGSLSIVRYLLKQMQSNADLQNKTGELPIHVLCSIRRSYLLTEDIIHIFRIVSSFTKNPNSPNAIGNTPLHIACELSDERIVQHLVEERQCDVDICNNVGELPLHLACVRGSLSIARMVRKCDPNSQIKEDDGDTPLHIACRQTNLDLVKFLTEEMNCSCCISNKLGELPLHIACTKLSHYSTRSVVELVKLVSSCDVDSMTAKGTTALHMVCEREEQEIIQYLIQTKKCKTTIHDRKGNRPLHIVCSKSRISKDTLNLLCDQSSQTVQNNDGELPLHIACSHKSLDWIKMVSNCDVNTRTTSGNTALHLACSRYGKDHIQIIKYLTEEKQCNANIQNDKGELPLHIACEKGSLEMVRLVSDCDVNLQTENEDSPIHIACRGRETSIIEFLVNTKQCNLATPNKSNELPIHIACSKHPLDVVKLVSKGKMDVNSQTQTGDTPLHIAFSRNATVHKDTRSYDSFYYHHEDICYRDEDENLQLVKYLVREKQCSLSIPNHNNELPVHIACRRHSLDIVKVVSEGQVDLNAQTQTGDTPLHIACSRIATVHKDTRSYDSFYYYHEDYCCRDEDTWLHDSFFHYRDEDENLQLVKYLVREKQCSLSIPNHNNELPVHIACRRHSLDIVKVVSEGQVDLNAQTQTGDTSLHIACSRNATVHKDTRSYDSFYYYHEDHCYCDEDENLQLVKYLVREKQCSLSIPNHNNELPVHIACRHHSLDIVKVVSEGQVDFNVQTQSGDTPLHIACEEAVGKIEVDEVHKVYVHNECKRQRTEVVRYLAVVKKCDPTVQNNSGDLPLHIICRGRASLELVKLVSNCNVDAKTKSGDTPLHEVCKNDYIVRSSDFDINWETVNELLIFLIKSKGCDPNCQDNEGKSPLHCLCGGMYETSAKKPVQCLLSTGRVNPSLADSKGQTPLMLTSDKEVIKLLLSHGADPSPLYDMNSTFFEKYSKSPPPTPLKVLVLGEASTGKTTLTLTLKCEGCPDAEQIPPQDHTAGIIPSDFNSETYGLVTFYDFAGQHEYYASHEAIIHCVVRKSPPVILLLVKLSEDRNKIRQKLLKWLAYVDNLTVSVQGTAHLIIVGSHADEVRGQGEDPQVKMKSVLGPLQSQFKGSCVEFIVAITMDCRQPNSMDVDKLRQHLKDSSSQLRDVGVMNFISHCVYVCLLSQFSSVTAVPLPEVITAIGRITKHSYYSYTNKEARTLLPKESDDVAVILQELNDRGHIIFLENHERIWKSWIIFNKEAILADLNGTIFAPQSFVQYQDMTSNSTGVVKFSKIVQCRVLEQYNPNMLVGFLSHMEFCQEIHDREVLDILGCPPIDFYPSAERYFFFPGLVKLEAPQEIWTIDRLFKYKCGWILQCTHKDQFLTPHFLQVLVLRLAFTFALSPSKPSAKCDLPVITRHCTVWKNGIQWLNRDGIEAVVEVVEQSQAVIVMLRCSGKIKSEWACLHLRSAIIHKVLDARKELCPNVSTAESFIHPDDVCYPPKPSREMCLYSIESIAETVVEAKPFILPSQGQSHVAIEELLLLEVYADLGEDVLHKLFGRSYKRPSDKFLYEIADAIAQDESTCNQKKELFCFIFKPLPTLLAERVAHAPAGMTHELVRILQIGRDRERRCTIRSLRKKMDEYSIFCGRNPLVSCNNIYRHTLAWTVTPPPPCTHIHMYTYTYTFFFCTCSIGIC